MPYDPYHIREGDSETTIASQFQTTPEAILRANPGGYPFNTGQQIRIPTTGVGRGIVASPYLDVQAGRFLATRNSIQLQAEAAGRQSFLGALAPQTYGPVRGPRAGAYQRPSTPTAQTRQASPQQIVPQLRGGLQEGTGAPVSRSQVGTPGTGGGQQTYARGGSFSSYDSLLTNAVDNGYVPGWVPPSQASLINNRLINNRLPPLYDRATGNLLPGVAGGGSESVAPPQRGGSSGSFFQYRGEKSGGFVRGRGGDRNWGRNGRRVGGRHSDGGGGGGGGAPTPQEGTFLQSFGLLRMGTG